MNFKAVGNTLGKLLMYLSALMIFPLLFAYYYNEKNSFNAFIWSIITTFLVGFALHKIFSFKSSIGNKESYLIATLGWVFALLAMLGVSGMRLAKSEFPGFELDKIKPRIVETAKTIWLIYIFISIGEIVCLYVFGMPLFDAITNTFGTMPTGGFNPRNASVAYYDNVVF